MASELVRFVCLCEIMYKIEMNNVNLNGGIRWSLPQMSRQRELIRRKKQASQLLMALVQVHQAKSEIAESAISRSFSLPGTIPLIT